MQTGITKYLFTFIFLSSHIMQGEISAQSNSTEDIVTAPTVFYVELAGRGLFISSHYERLLFETTPHNIALSFGFGFWVNVELAYLDKRKDPVGITIPVYASYLYGGNHKLEIGAGITFAPAISDSFYGIFSSDWMIPTFIGYRYQPVDGGFIIRIGYSPIFGNEEMIHYGGIGLGYAFSDLKLSEGLFIEIYR